MPVEDFWADTSLQTTFINRITAFLKIPYDTVRIVGIVATTYRRNLAVGS